MDRLVLRATICPMAWTYADWEEQSTDDARLTRLRQWRTELRQALTLEVDGTGHRVAAAQIRQALADSQVDLERYEAKVAAASATSRPLLVSTRTRTPLRSGGY
jgi:hypothetical protein